MRRDLGRRSTTSGFTRFLPTIDINFSCKQTSDISAIIWNFSGNNGKANESDFDFGMNILTGTNTKVKHDGMVFSNFFCNLDFFRYLVKCPCFIVPVQLPRPLSHLVQGLSTFSYQVELLNDTSKLVQEFLTFSYQVDLSQDISKLASTSSTHVSNLPSPSIIFAT